MIGATVEDAFPLTPLQQGMLFHNVQQPQSGVDIQQLVASFEGTFHTKTFLQAWHAVTKVHPTLRTRFRWEDSADPRQEILSKVELRSEEENISSLPADVQQEHIATYLLADRRRGFNLAQAPLSRLKFFQLNDSELRLVWTFAHILLDGGSFRIVLRDVFTAYEDLLSGNAVSLEAPPPYTEFIEWHGARSERRNGDQAFFRKQLKGFTALNELTRPALEEAKVNSPADRLFQERRIEISQEMSSKLREVAADLGVTVNTCVQTAWSLVISDFASGTDDVVFGVLRAGRQATVSDSHKRVGLFINTVPYRIQLNREQTLAQLLTVVRQADVAVRPHEHAALAEIQSVSEVPSGDALFESALVFNADRFDRLDRLPRGLTHCHFEWIEQTNFPVTLFAYAEQQLKLKLVWDPAQLEERLAEGMLARLRVAIETIAKNPETQLKHLSLQSTQEREWIARQSETRSDYDEGTCMHHFFERQCDKSPNAIAVIHRAEEVSYAQLNAKANTIAFQLRALGVGPDVLVGLYMERSIDMVAGLFGILKAGGAYVPLDPDYPSERVAMMLEDCSAKVLLTQEKLKEQLPPLGAYVICVESIETGSDFTPETGVTSSNLAYVIFTSGSTGRPKGIMVEHRNVSNFFTGMDQRIGTEPGVWLAVTSISFDISVLELFWTLGRGFKVVLQDELTTAALQRSSARSETSADQPIDFGLFFFSSDASDETKNRYQLLLDSARFADENSFSSVWTPERHFHKFGGIFPNPAVTGAALATVTKNVQIRAGSCVLPLHHPIRVAEEWAVVDNLSGGRVGLSFAPGWHPDDFALHPEKYEDRKRIMFEGINTIKALWGGEAIETVNGKGEKISVKIFPPPFQAEPPIWITTAGDIKTFETAGEMGANILTNLLGQSISELADKISVYRAAWDKAGHAGQGKVTLMLHTFVGEDSDKVREIVREPFKNYLRTATDLVEKAKWYFPAFQGSKHQGNKDGSGEAELDELTPEESDVLMDHAFERYFSTSGLFGSPESCLQMVNELKAAGVTEIGCLIDFGVSTEETLASLPHLNRLRKLSQPKKTQAGERSIPAQIQHCGVTHMQCTPSLAQAFIESPDAEQCIRQLGTVMVGGETLPETLVERFLELLPEKSRLLNMYGPTETTVWSTVANISEDRNVTIGTPIANTSLHILDARMNPVPLGAPGELYIGGAGVVRGYLERPELTQERFVPETIGGDGRMYRTGDVVRYLLDGRLEFLGRSDHQIKLHGHRIELGEIETALARHPGIEQAVVVVREDNQGQRQLVAYLRNRGTDESDPGTVSASQIEDWKKIWQQVYDDSGRSAESLDTSFNIAGWISSYTGMPIPGEEMKEWVLETTENIAALKPARLLEIGCGMGLLLLRLAPECDLYTGVEFSSSALAMIKSDCDRLGLKQVKLIQTAADDLGAIPSASHDVVVINSVAQYFPNADYLEKVLVTAVEKLKPGGFLFVGDVRNLDLAGAFYVSVELSKVPANMRLSKLREQVARRDRLENELLIAPDYFKAFVKKHGLEGLSVTLKRGAASNEMNDYRYDVVLRKTGGNSVRFNRSARTIDGSAITSVDQLHAALSEESGSVQVTDLLNKRLVESVKAQEQLDSDATGEVSTLRAALAVVQQGALNPQHVYGLNSKFEVNLTFSEKYIDRFDAEFTPQNAASGRFRILPVNADWQTKPLTDYVCVPAITTEGSEQLKELQSMLSDELPYYMVPSAFVFLDTFPLTPNGKVDRKALPVPETTENSAVPDKPSAEPTNALEQIIAQVFQDLLKLVRIDIGDNFFELGANSLLMMKANNRLQGLIGGPLSLRDLFDYPTVASLAAHICEKDDLVQGTPNAG